MRASVYFALTRVVLYSVLLRFVISLNTPKRLKTAPTGSTSLADIEDIELVSSMRRGSRIGSSLDNAVTLVLNADYKPLSYVTHRAYLSSPFN